MALAALSMAAPDTIRFAMHYKQGDKTSYKTHMAMSMGSNDVTVDITSSMTVAKTYDDGGADLTVEVPKMTINFGGNEVPGHDIPPTTVHVDSTGKITKTDSQTEQQGVQVRKYATYIFNRDLKVGDVINVDEKDGENHTTGTITLKSVTDGVATLQADLSETQPNLEGPMKVSLTMTMDVASSTLNKMEGTIQNMPTRQGMPPADNVQVTMEKVTG